MNDFRETLADFRDALHREAEHGHVPTMEAVLRRRQPASVLQLRWAIAAMLIVALGAIPVIRNTRQRQREADQQRADALLMQQVNAGLSRSVPQALSRLASIGN